MQLKEKFGKCTKRELLDVARDFGVRGYSGLRKEQLIDKIVINFCSEEMVRSRLVCLTKEQMNLYRKACISPTAAISIKDTLDAIQLYQYWLGYFENPTDNFCVFEEIADVFRIIDDEAFKEENRQKGWMMKCIRFFVEYYGIAPVEVIYKMYSQKVRCSLDEMLEMMGGMPVDFVESCIFPLEEIGLQDWSTHAPLYTQRGLLIHMPILDYDEIGYWLGQQAGKDFFIPSAKIIDEICSAGYEASAPEYQKLEVFFRKRLGLNYERAVAWCMQVWGNSYHGNNLNDITNKILTANIIFNSEKDMNEFLILLINAHNGTRLKENRGHKPSELRKDTIKREMPTIVPADSKAAVWMEEIGPQLQAMGFPVDANGDAETIHSTSYPNGLNSQAVTIEKKIYPNDPCPCGSGKKYKKCCGR